MVLQRVRMFNSPIYRTWAIDYRSRTPRTENLGLNFNLSSEFFNKITVRILLDVFFRLLRFSKTCFTALARSVARMFSAVRTIFQMPCPPPPPALKSQICALIKGEVML